MGLVSWRQRPNMSCVESLKSTIISAGTWKQAMHGAIIALGLLKPVALVTVISVVKSRVIVQISVA